MVKTSARVRECGRRASQHICRDLLGKYDKDDSYISIAEDRARRIMRLSDKLHNIRASALLERLVSFFPPVC